MTGHKGGEKHLTERNLRTKKTLRRPFLEAILNQGMKKNFTVTLFILKFQTSFAILVFYHLVILRKICRISINYF